MLKNAGANVVRFCVEMKYYNDYKSLVEQAVSWCKKRNMYFILDLHHPDDCGPNFDKWLNLMLNPEPFYQWWEARANEFKDNHTVCGFDLMNEPPPDGTEGYTYEQIEQIWRGFVINATKRIHAINPHALIFIQNVHYSSRLQQFIDKPLDEPNIVYCLHRYYHYDWYTNHYPYADAYTSGGFDNGYALMKQFYYDCGFKLLDMGYPAILEEFGAYREDPKYPTPAEADPYYLEQLEDIFNMLNEKEIGLKSLVSIIRYGLTVSLL